MARCDVEGLGNFKSLILDEGDGYVVLCEGAELKPSKGGGWNLVLHHTVLAGPVQSTGIDPQGIKFDTYLPHPNRLTMTQKGYQLCGLRLQKACEAHGVAYSGGYDPDEFIGKQALAKIKHEDFNGEPQARIEKFSPLTQSTPN